MAPEQARGKPTDKRADIWAFGCVLYEMLTGKRVFEGEDVTITLAAALMREPDWSLLPAETPPAIRSLLRRCLEKDRAKRLADIAAALVPIEEAPGLAAPAAADAGAVERERQRLQQQLDAAAVTRRRVMRTAAAAVVAASARAGTGVWWVTQPAPLRVVRTEIVTAGETVLAISGPDRDVAITPDGSRTVYRGNNQLLARALDRLEPTVLKGLGNPRNVFVSPDAQWIGFVDGQAPLEKVAITGGPAVTVTKNEGPPRGAAWGPDDTIVYATATSDTGLFRVPAAGGASTVLTKPNRDAGEGDHLRPEFLRAAARCSLQSFPPAVVSITHRSPSSISSRARTQSSFVAATTRTTRQPATWCTARRARCGPWPATSTASRRQARRRPSSKMPSQAGTRLGPFEIRSVGTSGLSHVVSTVTRRTTVRY